MLKTSIYGLLLSGLISSASASVPLACGGVNDTAAMQAAIVTAEATGDEVVLPAARCAPQAPLVITDAITIRGIGFAGDGGRGYQGFNFYPIPAVVKGSIIVPGIHDTFQIATNAAVHFEKFQVSCPLGAASGLDIAAFRADAAAGSGNANVGSSFKDLFITNCDHDFVLQNYLNFTMDNVYGLYHWVDGATLNNTNYPHYGDSTIISSTFWGGANTNTAHIVIYAAGGTRVVNDKFNAGGANVSNAILIQPKLSVTQHVEPSIIALNSIEGTTNGIAAVTSNCLADMTQAVIVANQIWVGLYPIYSAPCAGSAIWMRGITISANILASIGNGVAGNTVVVLDGVADTAVSGNLLALTGAGSAGTGFVLGSHSSNVSLQSDRFTGAMIPANNLGTGNIIGGGSP